MINYKIKSSETFCIFSVHQVFIETRSFEKMLRPANGIMYISTMS